MNDTDLKVTVHDDIEEAMCKQPASFPRTKECNRQSLLIAPYAFAELVQSLVDAGADVNARDEAGRTPLMLVIQKAHALQGRSRNRFRAVIKTLLQNGADATLKNHEGNTALSLAATLGLKDIARLLKEAR